jgi:putative nucleotidyltransferase with HDIG domain
LDGSRRVKVLDISSLRPGFVIGVNIVDEQGNVLLRNGVPLTERYIQALRDKGYHYLYIREPDDDPGLVIDENVSPAVRAKAITTLRKTVDTVRDSMDALRRKMGGDIRTVLNSEAATTILGGHAGLLADLPSAVDAIMEEMLSRNTVAGLATMRSSASAQYDHAVEVCAISLMIGRLVGMSGVRLRQLATGALMHDIGKVFLDGTGNPDADIKRHAELGYEMLRAVDDPDILAPFAAYEHHERPDGTGLPRGVKTGNHIERDRNQPPPIPTLIGEIVAIANRYDHLLHGDGTGHGLSSSEVLLQLGREAGTRLNREIVSRFAKIVPPFPVGSQVTVIHGAYLGFLGVVCAINEAQPHRPVLVLARDPNGNKITPIKLDLMHDGATRIQALGQN